MTREGLTYDRKALAVVTGKTADWTELAKDAVAFASARGGTIDIGIADTDEEPPADQRLDLALVERAVKRLGELTVNVSTHAEIVTRPNGGEVLRLTIPRSVATPSRNDGKFFLRIDAASVPITGESVHRLMAERSAIPWEVQASEALSADLDPTALASLMTRLRASDRVKAVVKEKTDHELMGHYRLVAGDRLTNLGVLCVGTPLARSRLGTSPIIQAIAYDDRGEKIGKWVWDDHTLSPIDLVDAVWETVPTFKETYELRHGMLAQQVPAFDRLVIREVLVNALVHRPYTQHGDIFLNLHPDRLVAVNPGPFPPGVTPANILHTTVRRNHEMARLFHDLGLMEREGTGYDLMYAILLASGRSVPIPIEGPDRVEVTIPRRMLKPAMVELMTRANEQLQLSQRETIALGLLALHDGRTATELVQDLELTAADGLVPWIGRLIKLGVVQASGRTKGLRYFIAPEILQRLDFTARTTLTRIQPHRLAALIREDLARYPRSKRREIHERIGPEIGDSQVRRCLGTMVKDGSIAAEGGGPETRYRLTVAIDARPGQSSPEAQL
jgi:ATP-dependent DNA helicase RecG